MTQTHPRAILITLTALTALCIIAAAVSNFQISRTPERALPPHPEIRLSPSPENLPAILEAGRINTALITKRLLVPHMDVHSFNRHLHLAAIKQGWFPYRTNPRTTSIVMPAEELPLLDDLEANPIRWVSQQTATNAEPKGPSSLNLVKVDLIIDSPSLLPLGLWAIATGATVPAALLMSAITLGRYRHIYKHRKQAEARTP